MPNVGFCGGSEVRELGPASDMQTFFGCVELAVHRLPSGDAGLLTDRLYRRYLRLEELEPVKIYLEKIRGVLSNIPAGDIDWASKGWNPIGSKLDLSENTADLVLRRYFKSIHTVIENSLSYERRFNEYQPVMTIISDMPRFVIDETRPLAEYDALVGEPMWLRP